jgi:NAD(P)-dependent dehydrogenase (short-subunit alcohol dehydrogenase family)
MTITVSKLEGRVALVTCAARGMGEAHARALAREGARVVIADVLIAEGAAVAEDLGDDARFVGAIVNVSSMAAYIAVAPASAYTASKWGLRGLTKAAAIEFGPDRIRVNSLHPGMIKTPMIEGASDEAVQAARYPIPRFGTSEEVATTMLHLVCDATYSSGFEFCVDGGILAGMSVGD